MSRVITGLRAVLPNGRQASVSNLDSAALTVQEVTD
jgi:hypothetical protein